MEEGNAFLGFGVWTATPGAASEQLPTTLARIFTSYKITNVLVTNLIEMYSSKSMSFYI